MDLDGINLQEFDFKSVVNTSVILYGPSNSGKSIMTQEILY